MLWGVATPVVTTKPSLVSWHDHHDGETSREEGDAMTDEYPSYVMCDRCISLMLLLSLWSCVIITPPCT